MKNSISGKYPVFSMTAVFSVLLVLVVGCGMQLPNEVSEVSEVNKGGRSVSPVKKIQGGEASVAGEYSAAKGPLQINFYNTYRFAGSLMFTAAFELGDLKKMMNINLSVDEYIKLFESKKKVSLFKLSKHNSKKSSTDKVGVTAQSTATGKGSKRTVIIIETRHVSGELWAKKVLKILIKNQKITQISLKSDAMDKTLGIATKLKTILDQSHKVSKEKNGVGFYGNSFAMPFGRAVSLAKVRTGVNKSTLQAFVDSCEVECR